MKLLHYLLPNSHLRNRVYRQAVRVLVRPGVDRLNIPVVAITGTNGKSTVAKLISRILLTAGYRVGLSCSDGVMHNGAWVASGDQAGANGLWRAALAEFGKNPGDNAGRFFSGSVPERTGADLPVQKSGVFSTGCGAD